MAPPIPPAQATGKGRATSQQVAWAVVGHPPKPAPHSLRGSAPGASRLCKNTGPQLICKAITRDILVLSWSALGLGQFAAQLCIPGGTCRSTTPGGGQASESQQDTHHIPVLHRHTSTLSGCCPPGHARPWHSGWVASLLAGLPRDAFRGNLLPTFLTPWLPLKGGPGAQK